MSLLVIIMVGIFGFSAAAEKLTYYLPEPQYEIELTSQAVALKTPDRTLIVQIKPCNKNLIQHFWRSALDELARHPIIKGDPGHGETVMLDQERRLLLPTRDGLRVRNLDRKFLALLTMEQAKCR